MALYDQHWAGIRQTDRIYIYIYILSVRKMKLFYICNTLAFKKVQVN